MRCRMFVFVIYISIAFLACESKPKKTAETQPKKENVSQKVEAKPKEVIKKDPKFALTEKREEYRTTAYNSRLLPDPNSNTEIGRVPVNTKLKVLEKRTVQQGRLRNNWYKVNYKGKTGWISGWNMKEGEELVFTTVEEMERNYAKEIGAKPKNDPLTGKIDIVIDWLKKNAHDPSSVKYIQWYVPYYSNGYWNCRVEFRAKNALGSYVKEDKIFRVRNGSIVDVVDKW